MTEITREQIENFIAAAQEDLNSDKFDIHWNSKTVLGLCTLALKQLDQPAPDAKHRQCIASRFAAAAEGGLVDVKFSVKNLDEALKEQVCEEVEEVYEALESGSCADLDFRDSHRTLALKSFDQPAPATRTISAEEMKTLQCVTRDEAEPTQALKDLMRQPAPARARWRKKSSNGPGGIERPSDDRSKP